MNRFPALNHLSELTPVTHGGAQQLAARGLNPDSLIDFSATVFPGELPGPVRRAIAQAPATSYPDPGCTALRAALARRHGITADEVLVGNGSVALIHAVARASLAPEHRALIVGPTFGEYRLAVALTGAVPVIVDLPGSNVVLNVVLDAIRAHRPRLVFVCNPNNPTGLRWTDDELETIANEAFLIVDEAYAGFLRPPPPIRPSDGRIVLRSMTKDRGLAGLRVGYAVAAPQVLRPVAMCLTPWGVNGVAQAAARVALSCDETYDEALRGLWAERERLRAALTARGFTVGGGEAPYFLVEVANASATQARLLEQGILVRDCTSFGLPRHIRISPRTPAQGDRLVAALAGEPLPEVADGRLILVLGGARSGKSTHAEQLAAQLGGDKVSYIATAQIFDDEMRDRIARHRQQRPSAWQTLEEPFDVAGALRQAEHPVVIVECATLLASNWLLRDDEAAAHAAVEALIEAISRRIVIVVSNEVGSGIVPATALGRRFRDLQGRINRRLMDAADRGFLLVAGQPLSVKGAS